MPPVPVTLTQITPIAASIRGGAMLRITGDLTGLLGQGFRVYVGPNGDATDRPCYSGVPGQGNIVYPRSETELRCWLPDLPTTTGTGYNVFIVSTDAVYEGVLIDVLDVLPEQYHSKTWSMRRLFPPHWAVGPRTPDTLPEV